MLWTDHSRRELSKGIFASTTEVLLGGQVLHYWKNQVQEHGWAKVPRNPAYWFRGTPTHLIGQAPLVAIQYVAFRSMMDAVASKRPPTTFETVACAGASGALAGVVGNPFGIILVHQGRTGQRFSEVFRSAQGRLLSGLMHGTPLTMARGAMFVVGYKALSPVLTEEMSSPVYGPVAAGAIAAVASQPLDTLRRWQHQEWQMQRPRTVSQIAQDIFKREGVRGFYRAGTIRTTRFCFSTWIYSCCDIKFDQWMRGE
jgi:hypothetical protein